MGNSKSKPNHHVAAAKNGAQPHTTVTVQQMKPYGRSHNQDPAADGILALATPKKKKKGSAVVRRVPDSEEKYRSPEPHANARSHANQHHHADENSDLSVGGSGITTPRTPRQHKKPDHRKNGAMKGGNKKSKAKEKSTLPPPSMDTAPAITQPTVSSTAASSTPRALSAGTVAGGPIVFPDGHPLSAKPAVGGAMVGSVTGASSLPGSRRGSGATSTSTARPILVKQQSHTGPTPTTILVRVGSRRDTSETNANTNSSTNTSTSTSQEQASRVTASRIASVTRAMASDDSNPSSLAPSATSSASNSTETSPAKDFVATSSHDIAPVSSRDSKHVPPFLTQAIATAAASSAAASSEPTPRRARSISLPPLPTPRSVSTITAPSQQLQPHQQQQQHQYQQQQQLQQQQQQQQHQPQFHRRPSSLTVSVDALSISPAASPLSACRMMSRPAVFMDSFAWQRAIDPFSPNCSPSLKFDTALYIAQSKSLVLAMSLSALLHPTRAQLELLWQYCDSVQMTASSMSSTPTAAATVVSSLNISISPSSSSISSPSSSSSSLGLNKYKLLVLASELHAKLFLLTIEELKSQHQLHKWKKIHDILMKERPFLLPKEAKVKKSSPKSNQHQEEDDAKAQYPPVTPLQMAHLKSTVSILLRLMDLNGDQRISRQEFLTGWPSAAEALLGQKSRVDAEGKRKADGVIACNIM